VLNFIPNVDDGIAEMVRVSKSGGVVAAYVWDYGDKMEIMRRFWDVATTLDLEASRFDEGRRDPQLCRPEILTGHFEKAGLVDVELDSVDVEARFVDFDDYWSPFTGGQ
jgi:polynucleotide 5'-kinase involved in rRNA processing